MADGKTRSIRCVRDFRCVSVDDFYEFNVLVVGLNSNVGSNKRRIIVFFFF